MAIVLVVVGLGIGGIFVGRDLIKAAEIRALISQKETYNAAVNTFKEKYNYYPGDMPPSQTSQLGFFTFTGTYAGGYKDGNGDGRIRTGQVIETGCSDECGAFWRHLTDAKLIAGSYGTNSTKPLETNTNIGGGYFAGVPTGERISYYTQSLYMPEAKYGNAFFAAGNLTDSSSFVSISFHINRSQNVFFLMPQNTYVSLTPSLTAAEMFSIDSKIDDGMPNTGKIIINPYDYGRAKMSWWDTVAGMGITGDGVCSYGGVDAADPSAKYNLDPATGANKKTCIPLFLF